MELVAGANIIIPTSLISIETQIFGIDISELDFSAYSLAKNAKVCGDDDMIFYGQTHNKSKTIKLNQTSSLVSFQINLAEISPHIDKISICATLANEQLNFSSINYLNIKIKDSNLIATSKITGQNRAEVALIIGEFYRYQQNWKFRLISQGFNGGLKSLAEYFGVNIADEEPHSEVLPPPIPSQATSSDTASNFGNALKDIFLSPLKLIEKRKKQKEFQSKLSQYLSDGKLTSREMQQLDDYCIEHDLDKQLLFKQSADLINNFLHFTLANIIADSFVSKDEQNLINSLCDYFKPDQTIISEINTTIQRVNNIAKIKKGDVTPIQNNGIVIKNSEIIYLHQKNVVLTIQRKNSANNERYTGDLFVTSERIVYKSDKPKNILISNIISYESNKNMIFITSKTANSSGEFYVGKDVDFVEAHIEQSVKRFHRQIDLRQSTNNTRHIPQEIRNTVWQRCNGKCIECSSTSYLEFDHIIPFSKGGSNSENNIQLLCRGCNLKKSDRI